MDIPEGIGCQLFTKRCHLIQIIINIIKHKYKKNKTKNVRCANMFKKVQVVFSNAWRCQHQNLIEFRGRSSMYFGIDCAFQQPSQLDLLFQQLNRSAI